VPVRFDVMPNAIPPDPLMISLFATPLGPVSHDPVVAERSIHLRTCHDQHEHPGGIGG